MRGETTFGRLEKYSKRFPTAMMRTGSELPQVSTIKLPVRSRRTKSSISPTLSPSLPPHPQKALERISLDSQSSSIPPPKPIEVALEFFFSESQTDTEKFKSAIEASLAGRISSAIAIYSDLFHSDPTNTAIRLNLSTALISLGKLKDAISVCKEGLNLPPDPRLCFNSAIAYIHLQEISHAREMLELASKFDPGVLSQQITVAQIYLVAQSPARGPASSSSQPDLMARNHFSIVSLNESPAEEAGSRPRTRSSRGFLRGGSPSDLKPALAGSRTEKSLEPSKSSMWKAFKSIDEYDGKASSRLRSRGYTPLVCHVRTNSARSNLQSVSGHRKGSFITASRPTPIKLRTPKKEKDRVNTIEDDEDAYQSKEKSGKAEGKRKIPLQRIRKQGSFMQEDLEDEEKLRQLQFDVEQEEAVRRKFAEVSAVVQKEADKLLKANALIEDLDLDKTINGRLTLQALAVIRQIFSSDRSPRSQSRLLGILSPLKFFSRFQREVRVRLLDIGEHRMYSPGETIFSQGENGNLMFVILYGSVLVQKQTPDLGEEPLTIGTLYDGDSFGELSLFVNGGKRGNTARPVSCVAGEPCDLLAIPKLSFHNIIMQQVETAIETKLTFLTNLHLFEGVQQINLIPLASHIEPKKFKFGEVVIRRGERPKGLYVIMVGLCKVYSEGYHIRKMDEERFASSRVKMTPAVRPFVIGKSGFSSLAKPQWILPTDVTQPISRSESVRTIPIELQTNEKVLLATLQSGDYFGGRCLLSADDDKNPDIEVLVEPAKCTIVAESAETLLFVLTKSHLVFLGEKLAEQVKEKLAKAFEYDCPKQISKREFKEEFQQWCKYKKELVDKTYRSWFVRRNKQRIISALRDN